MNFNKLYNLLMEDIFKKIWSSKDIPVDYTGAVIWPNTGMKEYFLKGKYHREDGPAIERLDGMQEWWWNGHIHRGGGLPAIIEPDGTEYWCRHGKIHREDGPAVVRPNGDNEYWLDDKPYSRIDWKRELIRRGIIKDPSLEDVMDAI